MGTLTKEEKVKRFLIVSGLGIAVIFVLLTSLKAQDQKTLANQATGEGQVVYTFKDDADIKQFQQLVQAKQIVNTRIAVLQTYLTQEVGNIQQLNGQLSLNYKIDPNKNYLMDPDKKVVREAPMTAAQPAGTANPSAVTAPAATATPAAEKK